jgi:hypothetical protein
VSAPDDIVEPEFHAGRLRALLVSLVCIEDTPQVIEGDELADIRNRLITMARDESRLLVESLAPKVQP